MMKGMQFTGNSALAAIDRMEEKVLALEAEAESTAQVRLTAVTAVVCRNSQSAHGQPACKCAHLKTNGQLSGKY